MLTMHGQELGHVGCRGQMGAFPWNRKSTARYCTMGYIAKRFAFVTRRFYLRGTPYSHVNRMSSTLGGAPWPRDKYHRRQL